MCKCTPGIKTPFCGKPGCEWPEKTDTKCCDCDGDRMTNAAIELTGLAEVCYLQMKNMVSSGNFRDAQNLAWAYDCMAALADKLARELSDASP